MTVNPPEPVEDPNSYAEQGYDDRQAGGMDVADGRAVANRDRSDDEPAGLSDADRVKGDPHAEGDETV